MDNYVLIEEISKYFSCTMEEARKIFQKMQDEVGTEAEKIERREKNMHTCEYLDATYGGKYLMYHGKNGDKWICKVKKIIYYGDDDIRFYGPRIEIFSDDKYVNNVIKYIPRSYDPDEQIIYTEEDEKFYGVISEERVKEIILNNSTLLMEYLITDMAISC